MSKHKLIKFLNDNDISLGLSTDATELRFVKPKEYGRFATDKILEDDIIYRLGGMWITDEERNVYEQDYFHLVEEAWYFQGGLKYYLNGCHNHSCEPNAYLQDNIIRALRDINDNEEITLDYASFIDHGYTILDNCACGQKNCRTKITGNDWNIYDLPKKYNYKVSGSILRKWLLLQTNGRNN
jgi:hypothetical protein